MTSAKPDGYLAMPTAGKGDPVLVLHPWWGLNDTIKAICSRLADSGFVGFAPDLYHGRVTDQIPEAEKLAAGLEAKIDEARLEVVDGANYVRERAGEGTARIAVIGFSLGAFLALDLSVRAPELIRSVVVFYGTGPTDFSRSQAEYLGHFAENDPFEPPDNVSAFETALKQAGRPLTIYQYSGTGHWFFEPDRADAYNRAAAELAWDRTLAFLRRSSGS